MTDPQAWSGLRALLRLELVHLRHAITTVRAWVFPSTLVILSGILGFIMVHDASLHEELVEAISLGILASACNAAMALGVALGPAVVLVPRRAEARFVFGCPVDPRSLIAALTLRSMGGALSVGLMLAPAALPAIGHGASRVMLFLVVGLLALALSAALSALVIAHLGRRRLAWVATASGLVGFALGVSGALEPDSAPSLLPGAPGAWLASLMTASSTREALPGLELLLVMGCAVTVLVMLPGLDLREPACTDSPWRGPAAAMLLDGDEPRVQQPGGRREVRRVRIPRLPWLVGLGPYVARWLAWKRTMLVALVAIPAMVLLGPQGSEVIPRSARPAVGIVIVVAAFAVAAVTWRTPSSGLLRSLPSRPLAIVVVEVGARGLVSFAVLALALLLVSGRRMPLDLPLLACIAATLSGAATAQAAWDWRCGMPRANSRTRLPQSYRTGLSALRAILLIPGTMVVTITACGWLGCDDFPLVGLPVAWWMVAAVSVAWAVRRHARVA